MSGRYLITAGEIALLRTLEQEKVQEILDNIEENRWLFDSYNKIEDDVEAIRRKVWRMNKR